VWKASLFDVTRKQRLWVQQVEVVRTGVLTGDGTAYLAEVDPGDKPVRNGFVEERDFMLARIEPTGKRGSKRKLPNIDISAIALDPKSGRLASLSYRSAGGLWIVDIENENAPAVRCADSHDGGRRLFWTADGALIVSEAEGSPYNYEWVASRPGEKRSVWRAKGHAAASCSHGIAVWTQEFSSATLQLWNPGQKEPVYTTKLLTSSRVLPIKMVAVDGGRYLAVAGEGWLRLFDAATGTLVDAYNTSSWGSEVALWSSTDGAFLAHATRVDGDQRLRVFDTKALLAVAHQRAARAVRLANPAAIPTTRVERYHSACDAMDRVFSNPQTKQRVTVSSPLTERFQSRTVSGSGDAANEHVFADQHAATDGYLAFVRRLLDDGYTELAPRLTFRRGEATIELRPPVTDELERSVDGKLVWTSYDSVTDAIRAYNELMRRYIGGGYELVLPNIDQFRPHGISDRQQGADVQLREGTNQLHGITTYADGDKVGPMILFRADGSVESITMIAGANQLHWAKTFDESGRVIEAEEYNLDGQKRGTWIKTDAAGSTMQQYRDDGSVAAIRWLRPDGTVASYKEFDEHGKCSRDEVYDDAGQLSRRSVRKANWYWDMEEFYPGGKVRSGSCELGYDLDKHGPYTHYDETGAKIRTTWWERGKEVAAPEKKAAPPKKAASAKKAVAPAKKSPAAKAATKSRPAAKSSAATRTPAKPSKPAKAAASKR
jgi:antitoxin component YwqK of YwqJK toxin-antitoxin module